MKKYPKINSIYKRDEKGNFITGKYSEPEIEYLKDLDWEWTEKIDGTNIQIEWDAVSHKAGILIPPSVIFRGRTKKAQIPTFLVDKLREMFPHTLFEKHYPDTSMILYGEGHGAKIQKGGGKYIPDGVSFILFDVLIDNIWLQRKDVEDIASKLGINAVPFIRHGTINEAIEHVKNGFISTFGDFIAEGLVLKTRIPLLKRNGKRIITKIKHRDFKVKDDE